MTFEVLINGVDRTELIEASNFTISNILTREVDTAQFGIKYMPPKSLYKPIAGERVQITIDGEIIFGGLIVRTTQKLDSYGVLNISCECSDYTRFADKKLVADTYEDMTVSAIISDIASRYLSGFNTANVDCDANISFIAFNYAPVSECLTQLADYVNYDWYIDYNKGIHFFAKDTTPAPFIITDSNGSYDTNTLTIKADNTKVKNSIIVRGGEYVGTDRTTKIKCTGEENKYNIFYRYKELRAWLTPALTSIKGEITIGIDGTDDITDFDCLWNFDEKVLTFEDGWIPAVDDILEIVGKPYVPVIMEITDETAINEMAAIEGGDGEYQYIIVDKTIETKEGATERANAELLTYKNTITECTFSTEKHGLKAGQQIEINSTVHGINEKYIINQVTTKLWTNSVVKYDVSLVTTKTYTLIEYLQQRVKDINKQIVISKDEIVDLVTSYSERITFSEEFISDAEEETYIETITIGEELTDLPLDTGYNYVLGEITPDATERVFVLDGSLLY